MMSETTSYSLHYDNVRKLIYEVHRTSLSISSATNKCNDALCYCMTSYNYQRNYHALLRIQRLVKKEVNEHVRTLRLMGMYLHIINMAQYIST